MKKYNVAILGATGAVGQEFLNLIEERNFPFANLKMLASKRSAGKKIQFMGKEYTVEEATEDSFKDVQIALFAGGGASKVFAPAAVKAGADMVVLCSSDDEYADYGVPAFNALKAADPKAIFIIAGAPACAEDLKAAGIENFIHVRVDQLKTLKELNAKLGIK